MPPLIGTMGAASAKGFGLTLAAAAVIPRGLFAGGYTTTGPTFRTNSISFVTIGTTGNATDFGDLTQTSNDGSTASSNTRGVFYLAGTPGGIVNTLEYVTIAASGNATDFGDLTQTASQGTGGGCSNQTRGLFAGAYTATAQWNVIAYITIATTGNSVYFGDLTIQRGYLSAVTSATRAVFGSGGYVESATFFLPNVVDYVTIVTTGNAIDFGDIAQGTYQGSSCSNSTRGLFAGGSIFGGALTNVISYITIASTGNSTDFGDLSAAKRSLAGCSSPTRGLFGGGYTTENINVIEYVTIATTGNTTDFGDLVFAQSALMSCSNAHGGVA
jgi:hypothetical protein